MTLPGTDEEFETYLKRRTVLPNGMSDDDKLEPPKALDASVLQEARAAIHAQQRLNRAPRWARPVALAATILLCLSILLNVSLNTNRPTADGTSSREAILPEAKVVEPRASRPPVLAEANTPAPDSRRAHVTAVDKATAFANGSRPHSPAPSDAAPAASSAAEKADRLAERVGIPVQAVAEAPSTANSAADKAARLADRSRTAAEARGESQSADSAMEMERSVAGTGAVRAPPAAARAQAPASAAAGPPHPQDPKTWLQQIAALRAAGKTAQADAEMLRFRAAFPAYPAEPDPSAASEPPK